MLSSLNNALEISRKYWKIKRDNITKLPVKVNYGLYEAKPITDSMHTTINEIILQRTKPRKTAHGHLRFVFDLVWLRKKEKWTSIAPLRTFAKMSLLRWVVFPRSFSGDKLLIRLTTSTMPREDNRWLVLSFKLLKFVSTPEMLKLTLVLFNNVAVVFSAVTFELLCASELFKFTFVTPRLNSGSSVFADIFLLEFPRVSETFTTAFVSIRSSPFWKSKRIASINAIYIAFILTK